MHVSRPNTWLIAGSAVAFLLGGFSHSANAQSNQTATPAETGVTIGMPEIDLLHSNLVPGILPPLGQSGLSQYFSQSGNRSIILGSPSGGENEDVSLFWLEMNSRPQPGKGVSAQIGLGFAPRPDLGIAFGPVFELNGPIGKSIGNDTSHDYDVTPTHRPGDYYNQEFSSRRSNNSGTDDAGIAASLSYMPFKDIWIGLHGRLTSDLTSAPNTGGTDSFDAMLGLTAGYRLEF